MTGRAATPGLLLLGAVVFALLRGAADVTFNATPLVIGVIALAATAAGRRTSWGAGLVLVLWGAAVLLVREGPLPAEREPAAFLVAVGAGLVLAALVTAQARRVDALIGGATAALLGGLAFYFAFDYEWLLDWPFWTAALVAWAGWEARPAAGR